MYGEELPLAAVAGLTQLSHLKRTLPTTQGYGVSLILSLDLPSGTCSHCRKLYASYHHLDYTGLHGSTQSLYPIPSTDAQKPMFHLLKTEGSLA